MSYGDFYFIHSPYVKNNISLRSNIIHSYVSKVHSYDAKVHSYVAKVGVYRARIGYSLTTIYIR